MFLSTTFDDVALFCFVLFVSMKCFRLLLGANADAMLTPDLIKVILKLVETLHATNELPTEFLAKVKNFASRTNTFA